MNIFEQSLNTKEGSNREIEEWKIYLQMTQPCIVKIVGSQSKLLELILFISGNEIKEKIHL